MRVRNNGNVNERFEPRRALVMLKRKKGKKRTIARLRAPARSFLPGTGGNLIFTYRGKVRGKVKVIVRLRPTPAAQAGPRIGKTPKILRLQKTVRL